MNFSIVIPKFNPDVEASIELEYVIDFIDRSFEPSTDLFSITLYDTENDFVVELSGKLWAILSDDAKPSVKGKYTWPLIKCWKSVFVMPEWVPKPTDRIV